MKAVAKDSYLEALPSFEMPEVIRGPRQLLELQGIDTRPCF
jgi:hypothetical protein